MNLAFLWTEWRRVSGQTRAMGAAGSTDERLVAVEVGKLHHSGYITSPSGKPAAWTLTAKALNLMAESVAESKMSMVERYMLGNVTQNEAWGVVARLNDAYIPVENVSLSITPFGWPVQLMVELDYRHPQALPQVLPATTVYTHPGVSTRAYTDLLSEEATVNIVSLDFYDYTALNEIAKNPSKRMIFVCKTTDGFVDKVRAELEGLPIEIVDMTISLGQCTPASWFPFDGVTP